MFRVRVLQQWAGGGGGFVGEAPCDATPTHVGYPAWRASVACAAVWRASGAQAQLCGCVTVLVYRSVLRLCVHLPDNRHVGGARQSLVLHVIAQVALQSVVLQGVLC